MQSEIETSALESRTLSLPDQARKLQVIDRDSLERAASLLLIVKALRKELDDTFDTGIKKAHEAHKAAVALKKKYELPLATAEATIKPRIAAYHALKEQIRRDEENRLMEEARKRADEEKLSMAVRAETLGLQAQAEAIIDQPAFVPVVTLPKAEKIEGISMRKTWKYRIIDVNLIPRDYMIADEKKIGGVVRAMGEQAKIPGVEIYCETSVAGKVA